ncbi:hypothetical protein [Pseudomonas syringae group genomosp. 3]|uniref:Uncharacterized protein n=1 Tax=Pseudomonas syringae pv. coriandricola TaxID=264453 RepID=A0A3M3JP75_9PSED|nr:hypothetical protein [Pseudomonas syringae group genomosp. 3]RMN11901.1 hypothetical protein ALQ65_00602 [Pseudomonas syringae pv. coriandricola]
MYLVLHNIENGALQAKKITEQVNRKEFTVSHATDIFVALEKSINIYIENNFNHQLDGVEELLTEALSINKTDTIRAIKKSFYKHGELVKIMLGETEYSSLTKFLISFSEKALAVEMTRRREMSIQQMIIESPVY